MTARATLSHALAFVLSASALGVAACERSPAPTAEQKPAAQAQAAVQTRFAKVAQKELPRSLEITGTLEADERSEVAAQASGVVKKVNVDVGSRVKKGDILAELDLQSAALQAQSARASLEQAMARLGIREPGQAVDVEKLADVRAARDARDLARLDLERAQKLFDSQALSQKELDMAKSNAERTQAQYETALSGAHAARAALSGAMAQASLASKTVADTRVRAPFDGAIVEKRIAPGEFASVGRVVAVLVRDNPLRLRFDVPEGDIGGLAVGKPVTLRVEAYPGEVFEGEIKRIGASVKPQSRTLPVEAEVPNDEGLLKVGFFASAHVGLEGAPKKATFVPKDAVDRRGGTPRVFVRSGNRVEERLVTLGREEAGLVEVRGRLEPDAEVAVQNLGELSDGAEVAAAP